MFLFLVFSLDNNDIREGNILLNTLELCLPGSLNSCFSLLLSLMVYLDTAYYQGRREGWARGGRCPPWISKFFTNNNSTLHWNVSFAPSTQKTKKTFLFTATCFRTQQPQLIEVWDYYNSNNIKLWVPSSNG